VVLSCDVFQSNVNGDNKADIDQTVDQRADNEQSADVMVDLDQDNVRGSNHANVAQSISQSTTDMSGPQSQTANFDADVFQDTDEGGNNFLQQSQVLNQDGKAGTSGISQSQTADHFGEVDQETSEDGESEYFLAAGNAFLAQTEGFSKATVSQTERQTLTGTGFQSQFGPMNCCGVGSQEGNPAQTSINIDQKSTQKASQFPEGGVSEDQLLTADCRTTGTCTLSQNATNEAASLNQKVSGTGIQELFTSCFAFSGEGSGGECFAGGGG
jgi:hypothetical protein